MKQSAAYAAIRQIATLGHAGRAALPAICAALHDIVPHEKLTFVWLDEQCNGIDWYGPLAVPPAVMGYYVERYHNREEGEVIPSNRRLIDSLGTDRSATISAFTRSDLFNEIFRAGGNQHFLRLAVRDASRPLGIFYLLRPSGTKNFTAQDETNLSRVAPWITHALAVSTPASPNEKLVDAGSGLLVADAKGRILLVSEDARELLYRASGVPVGHESLSDHGFRWARPLIDKLMHSLTAAEGSVPALRIRNADGLFVLRAYWLDSAVAGESRSAAIQIQKQVPLSLQLMASPHLRKLPPREQQACLLLTLGRSSGEIAGEMGISRDGAVYHIRSTYNRLGISSREELVGALLGAAT